MVKITDFEKWDHKETSRYKDFGEGGIICKTKGKKLACVNLDTGHKGIVDSFNYTYCGRSFISPGRISLGSALHPLKCKIHERIDLKEKYLNCEEI